MPNWVFNSVVVSGDKQELERLVSKLGAPVSTKAHQLSDLSNGEMEMVDVTLDKPVFSFLNVVAPTDLDAYWGEVIKKEETWVDGKFDGEAFGREFARSMAENNDWYHWNVRNWGTKWDIGVANGEKYSNTILEWTEDDSVMYRFETAWSPTPQIFGILAEEFPTLGFNYEYEEETGWGGEMNWDGGVLTSESDYDSPNSHEDYVTRGQECVCSHEDDKEYWYEDCPK